MYLTRYKLTQEYFAAMEPIDLADLKQYLRITHDDEDYFLGDLIVTARSMCEAYTGLALMARTCTLYLDRWPEKGGDEWWDGLREGADVKGQAREIILPIAPVESLESLSVVVYTAETGSAMTVLSTSDFVVDKGPPSRVRLREGVAVPVPGRSVDGVKITFIAGYSSINSYEVPASLRQGLRQLIAYLYENRGEAGDDALVKSGAEAFFRPFKTARIA